MSPVRWAVLAGAVALLPARVAAQGGGRDSVVYLVSPASRLEVKTGKAGLFGFAGHTHVIRARGIAGRVVYYPDTPAESRVAITVPADSLVVLTPPDTAEIRKVTETMRTDVLRVAENPVIEFVSTGATPTTDGMRVEGRLTLAGQTRDVAVDVRTDVGPDTLHATGSFSVKQTDFGIKPYRGGPGGTVRVADRVTFSLEVIGVRSAGP
jgi:polyisoprenoid-binding protein YceI